VRGANVKVARGVIPRALGAALVEPGRNVAQRSETVAPGNIILAVPQGEKPKS